MIDYGSLDRIILETKETLDNGRKQIFEIAEGSRNECERIKRDLADIQAKTKKIVAEVDKLEKKEKLARQRLMEVSKDFSKYSEGDIRVAYEQANDVQIHLALLRERESQFQVKRYELEVSLRSMEETLRKASSLNTQMGVVLDFIGSNLDDIAVKLETLQQQGSFALKVIKAQEEERKRVAREIHDGPAQSMANLVLRAEFCEKLLELDPVKVRDELRDLKETVRVSLQEVRKIIFDLRPMALDDLGFVPAMKRYIEDFRERYKLPVEFFLFGSETRLPSSYEITLFRMLQEGLNNVRKHAKATEVIVKLEINPEAVNVIIKDNGRGFDPIAVTKARRDNYGLTSLRERAELLQGTCEVKSSPGRGTELKIKVPVSQ